MRASRTLTANGVYVLVSAALSAACAAPAPPVTHVSPSPSSAQSPSPPAIGFNVGDSCTQEGKPGCSDDRKAMTKCVHGRWTLVNRCEGLLGCQLNAEGTKCDLGASTLGAPCTKSNEGNASCTPDKRSILLCRNGMMVLGATCKGARGCWQHSTELECDESISDLGDTCDSSEYEGKFACSSDGTMKLLCHSDKMQKDRDCKCTVENERADCN